MNECLRAIMRTQVNSSRKRSVKSTLASVLLENKLVALALTMSASVVTSARIILAVVTSLTILARESALYTAIVTLGLAQPRSGRSLLAILHARTRACALYFSLLAHM